MNKLQKALREMLAFGLVASIVILIAVQASNGDGAALFAGAVFGFLLSPIIWAIYRVGRFVIVPR